MRWDNMCLHKWLYPTKAHHEYLPVTNHNRVIGHLIFRYLCIGRRKLTCRLLLLLVAITISGAVNTSKGDRDVTSDINMLKKNAMLLTWAHTCTFATLQLTECAILLFILCNWLLHIKVLLTLIIYLLIKRLILFNSFINLTWKSLVFFLCVRVSG